MSTAALSPACQLLHAIDELTAFIANCHLAPPAHGFHRLSKEDAKRLFALEGRVVGLVAVVAGGNIPFEGRPRNCPDPSRYTVATGLPSSNSNVGMLLMESPAWDAKMLSLRAAVQAVVETEGMKGQKDKRPDTRKKTRIRGPKNLGRLIALKKAIDKGAKSGMTQSESAVEFTDGDTKKAEALLRTLRRHRDYPGLG